MPGELSSCPKLKELFLQENPLSDNRLKKMVEQKTSKSVLEYIRQHCPKEGQEGGKSEIEYFF